MNIDTIILLVLGAFFLIGFVRGFIREAGALVGFFIALVIANNAYPQLIPAIKPSLSQWPIIAEPLSIMFAYFGTFIAAQILIGIAVRVLDFLVKHFAPVPFLKTANRLAGGALGILEGVFLLSAVLYVLMNFPLSKDLDVRIRASTLAPQIVKAAALIKPFLPDISQFAPQFPPSDGKPGASGHQYDFLKNMNLNSIDEKQIPPEFHELFKQYTEYQKKNSLQNK